MRSSRPPRSCASPMPTASKASEPRIRTRSAIMTELHSRPFVRWSPGSSGSPRATGNAYRRCSRRTAPRRSRPPSGPRSTSHRGTSWLGGRRGRSARRSVAEPTPRPFPGTPRCHCSMTKAPTSRRSKASKKPGYTAVKLHAWADPERDAQLVRSVRTAFPDLTLMHDAEGRYDSEGAEHVARSCADVGAHRFEAPLPDFDLDGFRALRRAVPGVPVGCRRRDLGREADVRRAAPPAVGRRVLRCVVRRRADRRRRSHAGRRRRRPQRRAGQLRPHRDPGGEPARRARVRPDHLLRQAAPLEPFEHGVRTPIRTGKDGLVLTPEGPGLGIELDDEAIDGVTIAMVTTASG